jgi:hypothetical protein
VHEAGAPNAIVDALDAEPLIAGTVEMLPNPRGPCLVFEGEVHASHDGRSAAYGWLDACDSEPKPPDREL